MIDNFSPKTFLRKIDTFCKMRLSPFLAAEEFDRLRGYMRMLVQTCTLPPRINGKTDWSLISDNCRVEVGLLAANERLIDPGLDAITRWIRGIALSGQVPTKPAHTLNGKTAAQGKPRQAAQSRATQTDTVSRGPTTQPSSGGPAPATRAFVEFPTPLFDQWIDPADFAEALQLHLRRHDETYWKLHRAIVGSQESMAKGTLLSWIEGRRVPRSLDSFEVLGRIEQRYRLPEGYFKAKLPHPSRSASGFNLSGMDPAEQRRMAWHLPEDFNSLSFQKREEIVEWVRRVVISGSTDYRQFQAAAVKQRYAIRFPGVSYGGLAPRNGKIVVPVDNEQDWIEDPDLLSGVIDAPPALAMEMADLLRFKTSALTSIGFQRNGVWGEDTASQKVEHLGLMFGALAASKEGEVRGHGVPIRQLTFGLLLFPGIWDWYLQWRESRRGFYTTWEVDMLRIALAITKQDTGWLRQHPELLQRVQPIRGLVSQNEIDYARDDWHGACDDFHKHASHRVKEIQRIARVHRDPFEPIMPVLEAPSPVGEYRKITEEILRLMPDEERYPRPAAEAVRSFLMLRLGLHLGLRQKNLRQLMLCPRGQMPRPERILEKMKRGEIRWNDREGGWEVLIPAVAFKNADSSFFGDKPFRLVLPDLLDLYKYIDAYVENHRAVLLRTASDPGTFFVKTVKTTSTEAAYDITSFYVAWRLIIQRYGIYNPYTGRGAIKGLLPHGPHNVRDVLATHILKQTGSYEQASYAIQDTADMVAKHYGRFLPQDKAALAARILNQVWEAA
ncbi:hypothetical protein [Rhizobium lusitanum]|jgi:hypothetical protein|uniref:hypothetical protein n=1 Tax=Rhizobium lusitanum TaxID=293958 RepID=UPI000DDD63D7|nr:hypothetical protein [Rhizobium lusitanum]NTJ08240.1 hypothetical protein [Rhizobium lusitanum]